MLGQFKSPNLRGGRKKSACDQVIIKNSMWPYCIGQHIILADGRGGFVEYKVSWFIFFKSKGLEHLLKRICLLFFGIAQGL